MKNLIKILSVLSLIILLSGGAYSQQKRKQTKTKKTPVVQDTGETRGIISGRGRRKFPPENKHEPVVEELQLSKTELVGKENWKIDVLTKASDKDGDVLAYIYTVSGGTIIGRSEKVIWDLSGLKPGVYTITVCADDGAAKCENTLTKEVKIVE